jgi:hypothetical protein
MDSRELADNEENRRRSKRKYTLFKIPAYDSQTRRFLGLVQDINETGVQLLGVQVKANSTRTIIIQMADYIQSTPLQFAAQCRWCRKESPYGYYASGFEIIAITDAARRELIKLIRFVTLG